jgi:hypothetical protein
MKQIRNTFLLAALALLAGACVVNMEDDVVATSMS